MQGAALAIVLRLLRLWLSNAICAFCGPVDS